MSEENEEHLMLNCLIVAAGGALGAVSRYLITLLPMNPESGFPVKTFLINIAGSFLIGIVAALAAKNSLDSKWVLFLKVGVCGGFTTFSSFALETEGLITGGNTTAAAAYVILSFVLGILAVMLAEKIL